MGWLSAAIGAIGDIWSTNSANDFQSSMLNKQMDFNREVMQNRHQWEVADLKAAGLNPLMSVTSPTGTLSSPSSPAAHKANLANSAMAVGQLEIADKQAEAQLMNAKANAKNADTSYLAMQNQERNINSEIRAREVQNEVSWQQVNAAVENAKSQTELNKALTTKQYLENTFYPRLMNANLSEIETRIANSIAETAAKIVLMDRQGRASLTNAQAQVMMANTLEANGVSLRNLQATQVQDLAQKMGFDKDLFEFDKLIKMYQSDKASYDAAISKYDRDLFLGDSLGSSFYRSSHSIGKVFGELTGIAAIGTLMK